MGTKNHILSTAFKIIFILVSLLDIYTIYIGNKELELILTPVLPLILVGYYVFSVVNPNILFLVVLFLFAFGDVFVVLGESYIFYGILIFTIAILILSYLFYKKIKKVVTSNLILASLPYVIYFMVSVLLIDNFKENLIPVLIYLLVLISLSVVTFLNFLNNKTKGNLSIFIGAFVLVSSNSLIGVNLFLGSKTLYEIIIIITYIVSIYLFARGMIINQKENIKS